MERARIVLASADRGPVQRVAQNIGVRRPMVWGWQHRFAEAGVEGLLHDKTRKLGKPPIAVQLPLKSILRGCGYAVVSNTWINRKNGVSKFKIKEMGSRYFFIIMYCLLEKRPGQGDLRSSPQIRETQLQVWHR